MVVPAVVFTERSRQLAKRGVEPDDLLRGLDANDSRVEAYGRDQARRYAPTVHCDDDWRRLARDAMIAGHLEEDDVLWATNPSDFRELGLEDQRLVVP